MDFISVYQLRAFLYLLSVNIMHRVLLLQGGNICRRTVLIHILFVSELGNR